MKKPTISPVDERLCFALYSTSQAIIKSYRPLLQKLDMTYPQYLVYLVLHEQGELTVKALGENLHLDSGTLTPLLKRMERQNRIERIRSIEDERKVFVKLTPSAFEMAEEISHVQTKVACSTKLEKDQFSNLLAELKTLNINLRNNK